MNEMAHFFKRRVLKVVAHSQPLRENLHSYASVWSDIYTD